MNHGKNVDGFAKSDGQIPYSEDSNRLELEEIANNMKETLEPTEDENVESSEFEEYNETGPKISKTKQVTFASFQSEVAQPPEYADDEYGISDHSSNEGEDEVRHDINKSK